MFKTDDTIKLDKATYRVIELLGSGGQAQVWRVAREDGERFALKVACPFETKSGRQTPRDKRAIDDLAQRAEMEIAFLNELPDAQAHHILPCLDSGAVLWQNHRLPASLAPLMHEELSAYCPDLTHKPKPFSLAQALKWLAQLAHALAYIHRMNSENHLYIHRDIKPGNILLDAAANAYLTDFGILKAARHVGTTSVAYSYQYCAPEQRLALFLLDRAGRLENQYYLSPATDLYALGAVAHSLFAGGAAAQDRLAEESTVNTHSRSLEAHVAAPDPPLPVGLLGQIGGLTKEETGKLHRVVMDLQSQTRLSTGGTVIGPGPDAGLPKPEWLADRIVELVEKLLAPWPHDRPSASAVLATVIDLQTALAPCLHRFAFSGETRFPGDREIVLHLDFTGQGLLPDLKWIEVGFQGKVLQNLHPELIEPVTDTFVLAANKTHHARLTLPAPRGQGRYPVQVTAQVGGQSPKTSCEIEVFYSAQQLWRRGEQEAALSQELREAWLEQVYQGLNDVTAAYHYLQLLERLKARHPQQGALLDSFKERVEQGWQARTPAKFRFKWWKPKPSFDLGFQALLNKPDVKRWCKIALSGSALLVLLLASAFIITNLPPSAPSAGQDLQQAKALLEGDDQSQWPDAIRRLTILANSGNAEAMRLLGAGYYLGLGVDRDPNLGCRWYKQSAEAGNQEARVFYEKSEKCR